VAAKTIAIFVEKASRLYEQKRSAVLAATALEMYVRRWLGWAEGGFLSYYFGLNINIGQRSFGIPSLGRQQCVREEHLHHGASVG
jgi:hypothetical protein